MNDTKSIQDNVKTKSYMDIPLPQWREILAKECQVYVCNESYLAKRFDHINYSFVIKDVAEEIVIDNVYALLRFKYFPKSSDGVEEKIKDIIKSFTQNLKTSLIRVSFNPDDPCRHVKWLPDGCIAFRNGVYNFRNDEWLFKYNIIQVTNLNNVLYAYDPQYVITWYMNLDFEPLEFGINDFDLEQAIDIFKERDKIKQNLCFELMYNMSHDIDHRYKFERFKHLCEILGYLCYQSFSQKFVMFVGSGQNGKNSLLDGCFTSRVVPKPASIDIGSIEQDRFTSGALENKAHNIYLETTTDERAYKDNTKLKALTGSEDQTIESKGVSKYSGIINCKYIWSANDQDKIRFSDTTVGFRRRINIFEIWYRWDENKRFLRKGDYYDTTFSEDLSEIKEDLNNIITFIYFAMYGIKSGTKDFTRSFNFTENDWNYQYSDIDNSMRDAIENINPTQIYKWIMTGTDNYINGKSLFYDSSKKKLFDSLSMQEIGYYNYEDMIKFFGSPESEADFVEYFVNHDVYVSVAHLQRILNYPEQPATFISKFKKIFGLTSAIQIGGKPYARCKFIQNHLVILGS